MTTFNLTQSPIAVNLLTVRQRIEQGAVAANRDPKCVQLIAVSKTQSSTAIRQAYGQGQRDFGENYVQELVAKAEELKDLTDLRWHMIGHLQRNKARHVVKVASCVQSVDSPELCAELSKRAHGFELPPDRRYPAENPHLAVFIEVNIAREPQKSGCSPDAVAPLVETLERTPNLKLLGLMAVPPNASDPKLTHPYFEQLRALRDSLGGPARLPHLSMGMTADLEIAIAAGATIVRVGSAIFGERLAR